METDSMIQFFNEHLKCINAVGSEKQSFVQFIYAIK